MQSKQAQGLSINTVVIVIIALLVLTIITLFATDSLSRLTNRVKQSESATSQTEIVAIQAQCSQACMQAKNIKLSTQWTKTDYCEKTFEINGEQKHCWQPPINVLCEVNTKTPKGEPITCNVNIDDSMCSICNNL